MSQEPTRDRAEMLAMLRASSIPPEALAVLLERNDLLEIPEMAEILAASRAGELNTEALLEYFRDFSTPAALACHLPWPPEPGRDFIPRVEILDQVHEYAPFPHVRERCPWGVSLHGGRVYVAAREVGLVVADLADPDRPTTLGRFRSEAPWVNGVSVFARGDQVYALLASLGQWEVIDVTAPRELDLGRRTVVRDGDAWDVAVSGTLGLIAAGRDGLEIHDLGDLRTPVQIGALGLGYHAWGVAVRGVQAFVAADDALFAVDFSNPTAPRLLGRAETTGSAMRVWLAGPWACVACGGDAVDLIDIRDARRMEFLGRLPTGCSVYGAVFGAKHAYLADPRYGLRVCRRSGR